MAAKKYLPSSKEELKELVTNPEICLGDIDTSRITDMSGLFEDSGREDFSGYRDLEHGGSYQYVRNVFPRG